MTKGASERSRRRGRSAMMKARVFSTRASLLLLIGLINLQCAAFSHYSLLSLQTVSQKFSNVFLSQQGTLRYKSGALLSEDELEDDEMATFDEIMEGLMKDNGIPGAQLAVAKGGELKLFQGYGIAKRRQPRDHGDDHNMTTDHVMRISDLSRLITGVAVLQLVQVRVLPRFSSCSRALHRYQIGMLWGRSYRIVDVSFLPYPFFIRGSLRIADLKASHDVS